MFNQSNKNSQNQVNKQLCTKNDTVCQRNHSKQFMKESLTSQPFGNDNELQIFSLSTEKSLQI